MISIEKIGEKIAEYEAKAVVAYCELNISEAKSLNVILEILRDYKRLRMDMEDDRK